MPFTRSTAQVTLGDASVVAGDPGVTILFESRFSMRHLATGWFVRAWAPPIPGTQTVWQFFWQFPLGEQIFNRRLRVFHRVFTTERRFRHRFTAKARNLLHIYQASHWFPKPITPLSEFPHSKSVRMLCLMSAKEYHSCAYRAWLRNLANRTEPSYLEMW